jgi:RpiB/LacA/LacB family sugar-phosphate isomerase
MKLVIGADHGGFFLKKDVVAYAKSMKHTVIDVGSHSSDPSDYPDFALAVAKTITQKKAKRGILICGSGVGACIAANKFPGIRASVCHDTFSARQGVEDDDMNVLCLGARVVGPQLASEIIRSFLNARFSNAARHKRRLQKVIAIEKTFSK